MECTPTFTIFLANPVLCHIPSFLFIGISLYLSIYTVQEGHVGIVKRFSKAAD